MSLPRSLVAALFAFAFVLSGCGTAEPPPANRIDAAWHRQDLLDNLLARWLAVAPTDTGFMRTEVSRAWQVRTDRSVELTAQSRLVYSLYGGYQASGDRRYLDAAEKGAEFLLRHFRDAKSGGLFKAVGRDGKAVDTSKNTYGHAFAILAFAEAYRVNRNDRYRDAAFSAWRAVNTGLRDPNGGLRPSAPRNFGPTHEQRTQNPVMHMFEAMVALYDATEDPEALAGAQSIGRFVLYTLLQGNAQGEASIPEWYNENWEELPKEQGGYVDLGHQFEWAYLLDRAGARGMSAMYSEVAGRLLAYGLRVGYDDQAGGCYDRAYSDQTVNMAKGWWQQSECLRTLMHFAAKPDYPDLWDRYEQTLGLVRTDFVDSIDGGWRMRAEGACEPSKCPDAQPEPYHMTGMHREALNLANRGSSR